MNAIVDKYWPYITSERVLRRAAHLVHKDVAVDFEDPLVERQVFGYARDAVIREIVAALESGRYVPEPAIPVVIPKSSFSQRPGAILPYRDRIVCQAIMMCLAPSLDAHLSDAVWSWRVKKHLRGKTPDQLSRRGIFRESDITEFPFLKKETVDRFISPFDPWYALWPQFDRLTRRILNDDRFKYMVISDIAGYFENIELRLLHPLLNRYEPDASKTINLLMRHLRTWTQTSFDGSQLERGIPQGNAISSFLGNFFLKPVDDFFIATFDKQEVRYFRYVDDVRIVATNKSKAREAALALESEMRALNLNLQSAKTHILPAGEALRHITDRRLDLLDECQRMIRRRKPRSQILQALGNVALDEGDSLKAVRIRRSKPPLETLNLRVFRRWVNFHLAVKSSIPIRRFGREAAVNPNYAVTRDLGKVASRFPHIKATPFLIWDHICAGKVEFPYHEAELIRSLKMFSDVPTAAYSRAATAAVSPSANAYLRLQSVLLLCRAPQSWPTAADIVASCLNSPDSRVITAAVMASSLDTPAAVRQHVRLIGRHASPYATRLIQYIRAIRQEKVARTKLLTFVLAQPTGLERRLYEYSPFLRFLSSGSLPAQRDLRAAVANALLQPRLSKSARALLTFLRKN